MTRLLVTRPSGQADELVSLLGALGIDAVSVPTVAISATPSPEIDRALETLDRTAWLVITSVNGARAVRARLAARDIPLPRALRVAAVGSATAAALSGGGSRVDHVPNRYLTGEIASGLGDVRGRRVVLALAGAATPGVADDLRSRGAEVEEIVAYRTVEGPAESRDALRMALSARLDGVTFTSGSTVRGLLALVSHQDAAAALALPAYCIGPVTAEVARSAGFSVALVASEHTAPALAASIHRHFAREFA